MSTSLNISTSNKSLTSKTIQSSYSNTKTFCWISRYSTNKRIPKEMPRTVRDTTEILNSTSLPKQTHLSDQIYSYNDPFRYSLKEKQEAEQCKPIPIIYKHRALEKHPDRSIEYLPRESPKPTRNISKLTINRTVSRTIR